MSDVLQRALASPWNPQRGRERVESMDRMRGSVVAPQPSLLEDALAAVYRGIRPSQENLGGLVAAIKPVYHGSPHAFDQFKLDKIGTGEGAQAYGYGLYFAESPGVAKSYQERLAKGTSDNGHFYEASLRWPDAAREAADPLGPQHFLDWDRPLAQQGPEVRKALAIAADTAPLPKRGPGIRNRAGLKAMSNSLMGNDAYMNLGGYNNADATSTLLRQAGIPGIRYLDGGSRGAGQGTHNYVVFDDSLIEVLNRNGKPIK